MDQAMLDVRAILEAAEDKIQESREAASRAIDETLKPWVFEDDDESPEGPGSPDDSVEWLATLAPATPSEENNSSEITRPDTKGTVVCSPAFLSSVVTVRARASGDASPKGKRLASRPGRSAGKSTKKNASKKNPL